MRLDVLAMGQGRPPRHDRVGQEGVETTHGGRVDGQLRRTHPLGGQMTPPLCEEGVEIGRSRMMLWACRGRGHCVSGRSRVVQRATSIMRTERRRPPQMGQIRKQVWFLSTKSPGSGVVGNARALGARDRGFESRLPDHPTEVIARPFLRRAGADDFPLLVRRRSPRQRAVDAAIRPSRCLRRDGVQSPRWDARCGGHRMLPQRWCPRVRCCRLGSHGWVASGSARGLRSGPSGRCVVEIEGQDDPLAQEP